MTLFDRLSDKLGAFFSRGHVFAFWVVGTVAWLALFHFVPASLAKSSFAERANFHQLWWLSVVNIFTLFYCIWISNNQIRGNKANDEKFNLLADALAQHMEATAGVLAGEDGEKLRRAVRELREAIGKEQDIST